MEELLATKPLEAAVWEVARSYELRLDEQDLPASALDGIRRQRLTAVPPEITVPPEARATIDRLIALRTGLDVVSALAAIELGKDPAQRERADALGAESGRVRRPLIERIQQIVYRYGREQGYSVEQVNDLLSSRE
jgi:hypothetical protein